MLCGFLTSGCVYLHHVQLGDIDNRKPGKMTPFDVKVSETGINLKEAEQIAGIFAGKQDQQNLKEIRQIISLFQMGPTTGNGVYNETYAQNILKVIYQQCKSGRITGINAIRETNKYPVVSGEIVRVTGYCIR